MVRTGNTLKSLKSKNNSNLNREVRMVVAVSQADKEEMIFLTSSNQCLEVAEVAVEADR